MLATICVSGVMVAPAATLLSVTRRNSWASVSKRFCSNSAAPKVRTTRQARVMSSTMPISRCCSSYDDRLSRCTRCCTRRTTSASSGAIAKVTSVSCQFR